MAAFRGHRCTATYLSTWGMPAYPLVAPPLRVVRTEETDKQLLAVKGAIHDFVSFSCTSGKQGTGAKRVCDRAPLTKKLLGKSTTSGGRSGVDSVSSWTGAGSGVDSVSSWTVAGSGVDSVSSWNGVGPGVDSVSCWTGAGSGVDSVSSWNGAGSCGCSGSADSRGRLGSAASWGRLGTAGRSLGARHWQALSRRWYWRAPASNKHWRALVRSGAGQPRELRRQRAGRDQQRQRKAGRNQRR